MSGPIHPTAIVLVQGHDYLSDPRLAYEAFVDALSVYRMGLAQRLVQMGQASQWYIISADYGLLEPDEILNQTRQPVPGAYGAPDAINPQILIDLNERHPLDQTHLILLTGWAWRRILVAAADASDSTYAVPAISAEEDELPWLRAQCGYYPVGPAKAISY